MKSRTAESIIEFPIPTANEEERPEHHDASKDGLEAPLPTVVIGRLVGFEDGQARVDFPQKPRSMALAARTATPLTPEALGRDVILAFADGDPEKPVILGLLTDAGPGCSTTASSVDLRVDGERLFVTAQKEIVLRCGEASVTLTAAGKVIIKGSYVLSRSSGYNKIKGAAVDIN